MITPFCIAGKHPISEHTFYKLIPASATIFKGESIWRYNPDSSARIVCCEKCEPGLFESSAQHIGFLLKRRAESGDTSDHDWPTAQEQAESFDLHVCGWDGLLA